MTQKQTGFAGIVILIIVAALLLIGGGVYFATQSSGSDQQGQTAGSASSTTSTAVESATSTKVSGSPPQSSSGPMPPDQGITVNSSSLVDFVPAEPTITGTATSTAIMLQLTDDSSGVILVACGQLQVTNGRWSCAPPGLSVGTYTVKAATLSPAAIAGQVPITFVTLGTLRIGTQSDISQYAPKPTTSGMKTITDTMHGFSIQVPTSWTEKDNTVFNGDYYAYFYPATDSGFGTNSVSVIVYVLKTPITQSEFEGGLTPGGVPWVTTAGLATSSAAISGADEGMLYTFSDTAASVKSFNETLFAYKNEQEIQVQASYNTESDSGYLTQMRQILRSFRLVSS